MDEDTVILKEVETITEELDMTEFSDCNENKSKKINQQILAVLVSRAQNDDHEAFGKIYDAFIAQIYRYVSFRVPSVLVEDIVSDIFVKAWEKIHTYKGRKGIPFSSWLFRIAHNVVIDTYRTHKANDELDELHIDDNRWNDPRLRITQEKQAKLLKQGMNKLSKRYREILLLSFMSELSNVEIAKSLKIREGSVRILKHRALKKLKEFLPASMKEDLP
ncbi:RNA polymerase sigma factor [Candidatus Peribacteria bacterium]|nr:RNA polymerase sigma factor [Candidatus Peribacteria bacterium]